ncbi:hypothetical protein ACFOZ1_08005 [Gracilibacillus marinus]|uniref:Uncharacterized protein n=1 Tax=Gracilibacillus marinus TaxID=630535 RepID=A0ABV8VTI1_9BACI
MAKDKNKIVWISKTGEKFTEEELRIRVAGTPEEVAEMEAGADKEREIVRQWAYANIDKVIDRLIKEMDFTPEQLAQMEREVEEGTH